MKKLFSIVLAIALLITPIFPQTALAGPPHHVRYTDTQRDSGAPPNDPIAHSSGTTVTVLGAGTMAKTGYSFSGWTSYQVPGTYMGGDTFSMPGQTVTFTSHWAVNSYTITFDSAGGSAVNSITEPFGSTLTAPANPTKTGYTFAGWDSGFPATMPASNLTLTAQWTEADYFVTYDAGDGTGAPSDLAAYHYSDTVTIAAGTPSRTGFTFGGWTSDAFTGTKQAESTFTMPDGNVTLTAQWLADYTVTYDAGDGTGAPSDPAVYHFGDTVTIASGTPSRTGYTFGGWASVSFPGEVFDAGDPFTMPDGNVTLTAEWLADYTVTYDAGDGTGAPTDGAVYHCGDTVTIAAGTPSRTGYTFAGWTSDAFTGTKPAESTFTMPEGNVTLAAYWTINEYSVSYDVGGGTGAPANGAVYHYGDTVTIAAGIPSCTGYTFGGWTSDAFTGTKPAESTFTMPDGNVTLTAEWLADYSVTYDANGGTGAPSDGAVYHFGDTVTIATGTPLRTGYTFAGWTSESFPEEVLNAGDPFTMPDGNVTLIASWTINNYSVTYDAGEGTGAPADGAVYHYNDPVTVAGGTPLRTGYTFAGWTSVSFPGEVFDEGDPFSMPDGNVTLTAQWTLNNYSVAYDANGGTGAPTDSTVYHYNDTVTIPTGTPSLAGYTFVGWTSDAFTGTKPAGSTFTMPADNVTLTALWSGLTYTVTFNPGTYGKVSLKTKQVTNGQLYGELPAPTRSGYYFFGWYTGSKGSGALIEKTSTVNLTGNKTLYAKWTSNYSVALSRPSLTAKPLDYKSVKLTWKAVKHAEGYKIYRKIGGVYKRIAIVTGALSYIDTGLTKGTTYYYKIRAYRVPYQKTVYSSYSYVRSAKPVWPAISLKVASNSYTSIKLTWKSIAGATYYKVYRGTSSGNINTCINERVEGTGTITLIDSGLTTNKTYYYRIRAYDDSVTPEAKSPYCSCEHAKPVPSAPTGLLAVKASATSINLTWNAVDGPVKYEVYRATYKTGTYTKIATVPGASAVSSGLKAGKTYYYKVRAYTYVGTTKVYSKYSSIVHLKI